jgi:glycosyltransferase involved in cell wall biosynthesis
VNKISIVIRFRNEFPILVSTMYSLMEDCEASNLAYEFVMVDNLSDDHAADVLEDKFRRWVKAGLLKVVRYTEKPSTWCAINAGWAQATGRVLVVADAHISVKRGTLAALVGGALEHGGIWHSAVQLWGDNEEQVNGFGYDLRLSERFWGNPCRHLPPGRTRGEFWKVPMAGACLYAVRRDEVERFGLYHPAFRAYGGGEPYLDLKWWLRGSAVWCHSGALCRHAFGLKAEWRTDKEGAKPHRNDVYLRDGRLTKAPGPGEEYLSYRAGYTAPSSFDFAFNFSLAAGLLGGPTWCQHVATRLAGEKAVAVQEAVVAACAPEFEIGQLDDLIKRAPWESCDVHEKEKGI